MTDRDLLALMTATLRASGRYNDAAAIKKAQSLLVQIDQLAYVAQANGAIPIHPPQAPEMTGEVEGGTR